MSQNPLRELPRVDRVLARPEVARAAAELGAPVVTALVRAEIEEARREILAGARLTAPTVEEAAEAVGRRAAALVAGRTRRVLNATGVFLHTNLGRAPLSEPAQRALAESASGYASLEMDLETGKRGGRAAFAEAALVALTGAEAALVVNNCAAAVLLVLASVAAGGRVLVSRGELVEIGGSFRVPDILRESGAELREVGTTNRTRVADYARALDEAPAHAILRVHQGNFRMTGFVERPALSDLAELARERGVLLVKDLGGGALVDLSELGEGGASRGFSGEPTAAACIRAGADLVCFSGDKVLGGPQAGIVVGKRALVDRARRHPLARALRLGRLPLVALEATLASYLRGSLDDVPVLAAILRPLDEVAARAERWAVALRARGVEVAVVETEVEMGGGALADRHLASRAIALRPPGGADALAAALRRGSPAIVGRVEEGALLLDARTLLAGEDNLLVDAVLAALGAVR